jgi:anti-sigma B factor antagonist
MAVDIRSKTDNGTTVIEVAGTVDLYSAPDLRSSLLDAVPKASDGVVVDLREVSYMDSSGVAVLVEGLRSARSNDTRLVLREPSRPVMKVLELAKLDELFDIEAA